MKKNMSIADNVIRILVAIVIAVLFLTNVISATLGIVLLVVAAILLLTGLVSFCPIYHLFGLSTRKKGE